VTRISGSTIKVGSLPGNRVVPNDLRSGAIHNGTLLPADLAPGTADFTKVTQVVGASKAVESGSFTALLITQLPAGKYFISGKVILAGGNNQFVDCRLHAPGAGYFSESETTTMGATTIPLAGVVTLINLTEVTLECSADALGVNARVPQIDAIRVGSVSATGSPLDPV
jgi:hypothetical protein